VNGAAPTRPLTLGLRENLPQFLLLVAVNALVGGMLGQERTVLPLLAEREFGLTSYSAALTYVLAFGLAKAFTNYLAGAWSDRFGRKPVLVAGWLVALPVPLLLIVAPSWWLVVAANVLLGISQGLTWSTTVIMKIDLVGPRRRGLALGLNESSGYLAVALTAVFTGWLAAEHGLRPAPFLVGLAYAALGLGLSTVAVHETRHHVTHEIGKVPQVTSTPGAVFWNTTAREPALSSACQAGLVNNLNDGLAWGIFPVLFATAGLGLSEVGLLVAVYPATWGLAQLVTGWLSDHLGRKPLIVAGMLLQAIALAWISHADDTAGWALASVALGLGTALVYPALIAVIGDVAHPSWRARAIGVYRLWRDLGFAVGAVATGLIADLWGIRPAIAVIAGVTALSGLIAGVRMYETHPPRRQSDAGST
jgi:MFS family permease